MDFTTEAKREREPRLFRAARLLFSHFIPSVFPTPESKRSHRTLFHSTLSGVPHQRMPRNQKTIFLLN
jgi:hypothetical protein